MAEQQQGQPPSNRHFVGLIAYGTTPVHGHAATYRDFLELRRAVYVDESGYLAAADGPTESDSDDARSLAFAVVEDAGAGRRVVAALRLIVKGYRTSAIADRRLPVERYWPDVFGLRPAPEPSVEVSRLIARHEDRAAQHRYVTELYATVLSFLDEAGLNSAYGLVDPVVERLLRRSLTLRRVGEPRWIAHYNSINVAIEIDVPHIRRLSRWLPGRYESAREILIGRTEPLELAA